MLRAIDELQQDIDKMVFVSGIGCSSWIPSPFFNADVLHTTHGRPLAFATGVKLGNPELHVVVFTGDGDSAAIGGNHLIQAARKNIEILTVLVNNRIYGMTGGQVAPTTPHGMKTTTTPYGNLEYPFDLCRLVEAAGASYVARWTTFHTKQLISSMKKGLLREGFSFIEVVSQCPIQYGRYVGVRDPAELLLMLKERSVSINKAKSMSEAELEGQIIIGEFVDRERTGLAKAYKQLFGE
jgi:2-oxoglutarate ferredoxin oxidoreductase subunit beta